MKERDVDRCVTCPRKCVNKEKNMECNNCKRKQHFICAGIRNEDDRKIYIEGNTEFLCSNCITGPITNENNKEQQKTSAPIISSVTPAITEIQNDTTKEPQENITLAITNN